MPRTHKPLPDGYIVNRNDKTIIESKVAVNEIMDDVVNHMATINQAVETLLELMGHRTNSPIWPTAARGLLLIAAQLSRINNRLTSLEVKLAQQTEAYEENLRILKQYLTEPNDVPDMETELVKIREVLDNIIKSQSNHNE